MVRFKLQKSYMGSSKETEERNRKQPLSTQQDIVVRSLKNGLPINKHQNKKGKKLYSETEASYGNKGGVRSTNILAADLEYQPWAVQVKAIPTATVPVVSSFVSVDCKQKIFYRTEPSPKRAEICQGLSPIFLKNNSNGKGD